MLLFFLIVFNNILNIIFFLNFAVLFFFFFFSSRRRHTRSKRDWSSDVCSSDLVLVVIVLGAEVLRRALDRGHQPRDGGGAGGVLLAVEEVLRRVLADAGRAAEQIGRASCRERGEGWVGGVGVKRGRRGSVEC